MLPYYYLLYTLNPRFFSVWQYNHLKKYWNFHCWRWDKAFIKISLIVSEIFQISLSRWWCQGWSLFIVINFTLQCCYVYFHESATFFAWAVKFLFEHLKRRKYIWSKPDEDYIWKMSTIRLTYCTISDLRNLLNIRLDMVLVMQAILCVHAELKLKPMNISSFLQYLKFYSTSKFSKFKCKKMFLFYCMVLKKIIIPKVSMMKFLKMWYPTLKQLLKATN